MYVLHVNEGPTDITAETEKGKYVMNTLSELSHLSNTSIYRVAGGQIRASNRNNVLLTHYTLDSGTKPGGRDRVISPYIVSDYQKCDFVNQG